MLCNITRPYIYDNLYQTVFNKNKKKIPKNFLLYKIVSLIDTCTL